MATKPGKVTVQMSERRKQKTDLESVMDKVEADIDTLTEVCLYSQSAESFRKRALKELKDFHNILSVENQALPKSVD